MSKIQEKYLDRLRLNGVTEVYIKDEISNGIDVYPIGTGVIVNYD